MRRDLSARLSLHADSPAQLVLALSAAANYRLENERFTATQNGHLLNWTIMLDQHGTRLHVVEADAGLVEVSYAATVHGRAAAMVADTAEEIRYLRPSRYCESDALTPTAVAEFGGLDGVELLTAVSSWVGVQLAYAPGSSLPTDGALRTLLARQGICRDYAHLVVAFLRAMGVPARMVSVYAPGLQPMDFHAVAEALVDGAWRVTDATALAPRSTLVRIATGRDAADTAFLTVRGGPVRLTDIEIGAVADVLPDDDLNTLVSIG